MCVRACVRACASHLFISQPRPFADAALTQTLVLRHLTTRGNVSKSHPHLDLLYSPPAAKTSLQHVYTKHPAPRHPAATTHRAEARLLIENRGSLHRALQVGGVDSGDIDDAHLLAVQRLVGGEGIAASPRAGAPSIHLPSRHFGQQKSLAATRPCAADDKLNQQAAE
jgi:hypothetical protein